MSLSRRGTTIGSKQQYDPKYYSNITPNIYPMIPFVSILSSITPIFPDGNEDDCDGDQRARSLVLKLREKCRGE